MLCVLFMVVKKKACALCVVCKYVKSVLSGGGDWSRRGVCAHRGDSWVRSQALGL